LEKTNPKKEIPCSLGISNCQKTPGFQCSSTQTYEQSVQPNNNNKYTNLNVLGLHLQTEKYTPVSCGDNPCPYGYNGTNPLLIDQVRGEKLLLDRPNYTGSVSVGDVCVDQIYSPYYRNYGKNYTSYTDISGGQYQYYLPSDDTANAYAYPNYVDKALVDHTVFIDPMGVAKPEYNRQSLKNYSWNPQAQNRDCDSYTHDTLEFRQELMEKQSRKMNQSNWEYRYKDLVAERPKGMVENRARA
jgi:hypothetical protein